MKTMYRKTIEYSKICKEKANIIIYFFVTIFATAFKFISIYYICMTIGYIYVYSAFNEIFTQLFKISILMVFSILLDYFNYNLVLKITKNVTNNLKISLFKKIQTLDINLITSYNPVTYINIFSDKFNKFTILSNCFINNITVLILNIISIIFLLSITNFYITLTTTIFIILIFVSMFLLFKINNKNIDLVKKHVTSIDEKIYNTIHSLRKINIEGNSTKNVNDFVKLSNDATCYYIKNGFINNFSFIIIKIFMLLCTLINFSYLNRSPSSFHNISAIIISIICNYILYKNFFNLFKSSENLNWFLDFISIINEFFNYKETNTNLDKINVDSINGVIEFENISSYKLQSFTNFINKGEKIILLDSKNESTNLFLILDKLHFNYDGTIKIDGINLKNISIKSLHKKVGYILDEPPIFSGSIKDNIVYGKTDATDYEVEAACKACGIHDLIMNLKDNYDTEIDSYTNTLPNEIKYLITIARVYLLSPDIILIEEKKIGCNLIYDNIIKNSINNLIQGKTTLIIPKNKFSFSTSHKIILFDEGKIVDEGTHSELISRNSIYRNIYENI